MAATEALRVPSAVDLAAIVIGALTGGLLAAREGFAVSGVLLLAVTGGARGARGGLDPRRPAPRRPAGGDDEPGLPAHRGGHRDGHVLLLRLAVPADRAAGRTGRDNVGLLHR